jgi:carbamate kinase
MKTVLIAIGGNALFDIKNGNNIDSSKIGAVCQEIVEAVLLGYQPVITFGNGPQVGNLLEMTEKYTLPPKYPISLDTCVAWTQAEIGYFLAKEVYNQLYEKGQSLDLMAVNTTVVVDSQDPAFLNATKPVGNFYSKEDAKALSETYGWEMKADSNRGYRRVVPSPVPVRIVEENAIRALVEGQCLLFCGGGGGIPVIEEDGFLRGVEAVIDKDRTACLLAEQLKIQELVICTAVDHVCLHFGTPEEIALKTVGTQEARRYLEEGQFPPGSMGPKVESLVRFVEQGGERAVITRLENLGKALRGETGTQFVKES